MQKITSFILTSLLLSYSTFANAANCASLNNVNWKSDSFNAEVDGGYFHCVYKATAKFNSQGESLKATMDFTRISGNACDPVMHFELQGTCKDEADWYPIKLHDDHVGFRGSWAQSKRIGFDAEISFGSLGGLLTVYMIPS